MNATHLHLLLNHLPVLGTLFGLGLLLFGIWRKSTELKKTSLGVLVLVALAAVPVYLTGEPAGDAVESLPGVSKPIMEQHEEAAGFAFTGSLALGGGGLGRADLLSKRPCVAGLVRHFVASGLLDRWRSCGLVCESGRPDPPHGDPCGQWSAPSFRLQGRGLRSPPRNRLGHASQGVTRIGVRLLTSSPASGRSLSGSVGGLANLREVPPLPSTGESYTPTVSICS